METKEVRRFVILPVEVRGCGQIIQLDRKLPSNLTHCNGISISVKGFLDTEADIQHMGEISIMMNSGQVHPLHHTVGYSLKPLKKQNYFLKISEPLVPNSHIRGFYEDAGTSRNKEGKFLPYLINIYFDCKSTV